MRHDAKIEYRMLQLQHLRYSETDAMLPHFHFLHFIILVHIPHSTFYIPTMQVCIAALNAGVSEENDFALSGVLLSLSSREDPQLIGESCMLTLLMRLRMERDTEANKLTLRTLWNLLNYHECRASFKAHRGLDLVQAVRINDEDMSKVC